MTSRPVAHGEHGKAFAENLRAVCAARGVTPEQVAKKCAALGHRLTPDQVKDVMLGRRRASIDDACFIARAVEVKLHRLVLPSHLTLVPNRRVPGVFADDKPTLDADRVREGAG